MIPGGSGNTCLNSAMLAAPTAPTSFFPTDWQTLMFSKGNILSKKFAEKLHVEFILCFGFERSKLLENCLLVFDDSSGEFLSR